MEFVNQMMGYIQPGIDFFMPGLLAYAGDGAMVDWMPFGIQLGVIALVLALLMREFGAILIFTVVGVIIHVIVDIVMPMVQGGADAAGFDAGAFAGQFMQTDYQLYIGALAVGYFLAIIVLSMVKGLLFRGD
jgi:hypothetical protein